MAIEPTPEDRPTFTSPTASLLYALADEMALRRRRQTERWWRRWMTGAWS